MAASFVIEEGKVLSEKQDASCFDAGIGDA
jgi:hypothetical protein